jgi:hypothetical protein
MRKRLITTTSPDAPHLDEGWLDLDSAATVEVTSEAKEYPVESALVSGEMRGWRAADSGSQTIRLIFDEPQKLTRHPSTQTPLTQRTYPRRLGLKNVDSQARQGGECKAPVSGVVFATKAHC